MLVNCEECNKTINRSSWDINRSKHLFCSRICKETFYKKENTITKTCLFCKKTFETTKKNPKDFCNQSCSTSHNNQKHKIKEKECLICSTKFKRIKIGKISDNYCSDICYEKRIKRSKNTSIKKGLYVQKWRTKTKEKIVNIMGGKCQLCGYNKSFNALDLHHLNPSNKEFTIANALKNAKKWKYIEKEITKCVLLCGNCHREVHAGIVTIENKLYFNTDISNNYIENNKKPIKEFDTCPICLKEKNVKNKFCSQECYSISNCKIDWNSLNFGKLLKEFKNPEQIGKNLGVSGAAVRNQMKKRGL